ncbi:MAG: SpoIIIAH-like family protein [Clostridia bacterium]|nr:SpoIIIAH-like family protein [Clostridia bacterium]
MMKKIFKSRRPIARLVFTAFIIFCLAVLAWDVKQNGFSAAWGALPAAEVDLPAPADDAAGNEIVLIAEQPSSGNAGADDAARADTEAAAQFASLRLEREQARGAQLKLLGDIIADPHTSPGILEDAEQRRLILAAAAEGELLAESLLAAKGYGETVVIRGDQNATVIVDQDIEISDAAIIADIVNKTTDCGFENVVIVNRRDY